MKKILALILLTALLALTLCGCGNYTCGLCGEEKTGFRHRVELFGQNIPCCKECKEAIEEQNDSYD